MAHGSWLSQSHDTGVTMKHMSEINPNKSTTVIPLPIVKLNENGTDDCENVQ
jgi:hypothetical protein